MFKKFKPEPIADLNYMMQGAKYYFITGSGRVAEDVWNGDECDLETFKIGNVFKNYQDAANVVQHLRKMQRKRK